MSDQTTPEESAVGQPRPFTQWLLEQRQGGLHAELTDGLSELVRAVMEHEKGGSLTLMVKVNPMGNGINLVVSDEIKVKKPEAARPVSMFYGDDSGSLSRRDPRQPELPLREIPSDRKAG